MPWAHKVNPLQTDRKRQVVTGDWENNFGYTTLKSLWRELCRSKKLSGKEASFPPNLLWRASPYDKSNTFSHHQKFVVCDRLGEKQSTTIRAFLGGLDITRGRFDWPAHPFLPTSKHANKFTAFDDWYSAEFGGDTSTVRQPWHDIHVRLDGPIASDVVTEFVARWCPDQYFKSALAKGFVDQPIGDVSDDGIRAVFGKLLFINQWDDDRLNEIAGPNHFWNAQLVQSINRIAWGPPPKDITKSLDSEDLNSTIDSITWKLKRKYESSIQEAHLRMIEMAESYIYIESQFLISGGKHWKTTRHGKSRPSIANRIAETLVEKIKRMAKRKRAFRVIVVLPMFPEGPPDDLLLSTVRHLQWNTIEYLVKELYNTIGATWNQYVSFCCLANWEDSTANPASAGRDRAARVVGAKRYMIYVHSKAMIVDDRMTIIGSANLNERSLHGNRDSEIAVVLWPRKRCTETARQQLSDFRKRLWQAHLGDAWMTQYGNLAVNSKSSITAFNKSTTRNFFDYVSGIRDGNNAGYLLQWPITTDGHQLFAIAGQHIPETPSDSAESRWNWRSEGSGALNLPFTNEIPE